MSILYQKISVDQFDNEKTFVRVLYLDVLNNSIITKVGFRRWNQGGSYSRIELFGQLVRVCMGQIPPNFFFK